MTVNPLALLLAACVVVLIAMIVTAVQAWQKKRRTRTKTRSTRIPRQAPETATPDPQPQPTRHERDDDADEPAAGDDLIEQTVEVSHLDHERRNSSLWRAATFCIILIAIAFAIIAAIAVTNMKPKAYLYIEHTDGSIAYAGTADDATPPDQAAIKKQIAECIRNIRDIPGRDPDLANRNATDALYCAAAGRPADNDLHAYFQAQNPLTLGRDYIRTVTNVEVRNITPLSYGVKWTESLRQGNNQAVQSTYEGTVTLAAPPRIPDDHEIEKHNAAGVFWESYDLPWSTIKQ